jgi:thiol-disulfide isomerase/thioredoxin
MAGCFGSEPQKTGKEGKSVPEFSILLTDSTTWLHSRDVPKDKPFILFNFSPYCPYCKAQTKKIIENMDMLKDIHFYFISRYPLPHVKEYSKEFQLAKYPNVTVGLDSASVINDYFEIPGFPYMAVYGKDKKLTKTFLGKTYCSQLKKSSRRIIDFSTRFEAFTHIEILLRRFEKLMSDLLIIRFR